MLHHVTDYPSYPIAAIAIPVNEAIELWLGQPEQQETIDRLLLDEIEEE